MKGAGSPLSQAAVLTGSPILINYLPLILPHAWKLFSNLCTHHDSTQFLSHRRLLGPWSFSAATDVPMLACTSSLPTSLG